MPQLKTAKLAGPEAQVPALLAWGLLLLFDLFFTRSSLRDRVWDI